nr:MAG TPA: hypothetical protein [Bacteriophage sp.]DAZ48257.1 MAG TPA: hypothetical protein [Caudoviricetes sp.]
MIYCPLSFILFYLSRLALLSLRLLYVYLLLPLFQILKSYFDDSY